MSEEVRRSSRPRKLSARAEEALKTEKLFERIEQDPETTFSSSDEDEKPRARKRQSTGTGRKPKAPKDDDEGLEAHHQAPAHQSWFAAAALNDDAGAHEAAKGDDGDDGGDDQDGDYDEKKDE